MLFDTLTMLTAEQVLWLLFDTSLKGALLLALVWCAARLLRRGSAALRHALWFAAVATFAALPLLAVLVPAWHVPIVAPPGWAPFGAAGAAGAWEAAAAAAAPVELPGSAAIAPAPEAVAAPSLGGEVVRAARASLDRYPLAVWLLAAWGFGVLAVLGALGTGAAGLWWIGRRSTPVDDPEWLDLAEEVGDRLFLRRPVVLLRSTSATMPMTWGARHPRVLLPADADEWCEERRRCVLMHEFAHVARYDTLTQTFAQLVCAVWWFNPVVWLAARELRREREKACDDAVVARCPRASDYASHLIEIARRLHTDALSPLGAIAMARPTQLEGRVLNILSPAAKRAARLHERVATLAFVVCAGMLAAAMSPWQGVQAGQAAGAPSSSVPQLAGPAAAPDAARKWVPEPAEPPPPPAALEKRLERQIEALQAAESEARRAAARALAADGRRYGAAMLMRKLEGEPDPAAREVLVWSIGELRDPAALSALLTAAHDDARSVRAKALWALGELELSTPTRVGVLKKLSGSSHRDVRLEVARMAALLQDVRVLQVLALLAADGDPEIRESALRALGGLGEPAAAELLIRRLETDPEASVRTHSAWSLGQLGTPLAVEALVQALWDEAPEVRRMAAWALGTLADAGPVRALGKAARYDADAEVRRMAVWALGTIASPKGRDVLVQVRDNDEDRDVQDMARWALTLIDARSSQATHGRSETRVERIELRGPNAGDDVLVWKEVERKLERVSVAAMDVDAGPLSALEHTVRAMLAVEPYLRIEVDGDVIEILKRIACERRSTLAGERALRVLAASDHPAARKAVAELTGNRG